MKKVTLIILLVVLALVLGTLTLYAQEDRGNISGRVYNDQDGNGICAGTGEPGIGGIGIQAQSVEGNSMQVSTQADGNYTLATVAFGTWTVKVVPGESWRITSSAERTVVVNGENREVTNIDFCLTQMAALPEGGAPVAQPIVFAAVAGIGLLLAGLLVLWLGRRV